MSDRNRDVVDRDPDRSKGNGRGGRSDGMALGRRVAPRRSRCLRTGGRSRDLAAGRQLLVCVVHSPRGWNSRPMRPRRRFDLGAGAHRALAIPGSWTPRRGRGPAAARRRPSSGRRIGPGPGQILPRLGRFDAGMVGAGGTRPCSRAMRRFAASMSWRARLRAPKRLRCPGGNVAGGRGVCDTWTSVRRASLTVWSNVLRELLGIGHRAAAAADCRRRRGEGSPRPARVRTLAGSGGRPGELSRGRSPLFRPGAGSPRGGPPGPSSGSSAGR